MSVLCDKSILLAQCNGDIIIEPFDRSCLQSASYDLHLGHDFAYESGDRSAVRMERNLDNHGFKKYTPNTESITIEPGEFLLASTLERIKVGPRLIAFVSGKSSVARRGLFIECAGLVDPGFEGNITLELFNASKRPLELPIGMRICQINFQKLDDHPIRLYGDPELGSHYQGQTGATPSRSSF